MRGGCAQWLEAFDSLWSPIRPDSRDRSRREPGSMDQMDAKASVFWPASASAMATVMLKIETMTWYVYDGTQQIRLYTGVDQIFRLFLVEDLVFFVYEYTAQYAGLSKFTNIELWSKTAHTYTYTGRIRKIEFVLPNLEISNLYWYIEWHRVKITVQVRFNRSKTYITAMLNGVLKKSIEK